MNRLVIGGLVVGALGLTAFLVAHFAGAEGGGGEVRATGVLRATNRTHLSLCVDGAGGLSVSGAEVDMIREALEDTLGGASDVPAEFADPTVSPGCPAPVGLTGKQLDHAHRSDLFDVPPRFISPPDAPSAHLLLVYFVPLEVYQASFGGDAYAITTEERICSGDVCHPVTVGLYLTPSVSSDALRRALLPVLGLMPLLPEPTEYWQACMTVTPELWCYLFEYCEGVPGDPACKDSGRETTPGPPE